VTGELTYLKVSSIKGVVDPGRNSGLWLTKSEDGLIVARIHLPTHSAWSPPKSPGEAFRVLRREAARASSA